MHYSLLALLLAVILPQMSRSATTGIDVSHYQGTIDWAKVAAAGVKFAFAKATEGRAYTDPTFVANFRGMHAHHITAGAYHFYRTDVSNADQIALINTSLRAVRFNAATDRLMVDFETNPGGLSQTEVAARLHAFLALIESKFKVKPILYIGPSFWRSTVGTAAAHYNFAAYRLWIADYTSAASPTIPAPWTKYYIWQYTDSGRVPGIEGTVDMDRMA